MTDEETTAATNGDDSAATLLNLLSLDELAAKVPDAVKPAITKYGPQLLELTLTQVWQWVELLAEGRNYEAWQSLYAGKSEAAALAAGQQRLESWDAANAANAEATALQKQARDAIMSALLTALLSWVGL